MTLDEFKVTLSQSRERVENALRQQLQQANIDDATLVDAMSYSLLLGGKRVRPFLVYATGELFGVNTDALDKIAAAIEAIHTYSLIHDDLPAMDNDELRRGKPTCHVKYNEATAILAGDTLQSFAYWVLSHQALPEVTAEAQLKIIAQLSDASNKMCAGQALDLASEHIKRDGSTEQLNTLQQLHSLKTGALIKAAILMAATAGQANSDTLALLEEYADSIGLAFQVWDDVLDIISDTSVLGKPQGSDLAAEKLTYPALLGLEGAKDKAQGLIAKSVQALAQMPYNTAQLEQLAHYIISRNH